MVPTTCSSNILVYLLCFHVEPIVIIGVLSARRNTTRLPDRIYYFKLRSPDRRNSGVFHKQMVSRQAQQAGKNKDKQPPTKSFARELVYDTGG